jgi:hypothetical protein
VTEAVDGLELVADHEQPRLGSPQRVDQRQLDAIRVLELIHHQVLEALPPRCSDGPGRLQQRERAQLEVLEVGPGALRLQPLVVAVVGVEEGAQCREAVGRQGGLVRSQLRGLAPSLHGPDWGPRVGEAGWVDSLAAQPLVRRPHGLSQPRGVEARHEASGGLGAGLDDLLQRRREGPLAKPCGLELVEDAKAWVHASGHRMRREQAPAEPVDGRDPRPLALARGASDLPRALGLAGLGGGARPGDELAPHPLPKLARRPLGEREGEDRIGTDAVLGHGVAVALDEDAGLAGSRPRLGEYVARARLDRRPLLGCGLRWGSDLEVAGAGGHPAPFPAASPLPAISSAPIERSSRQIGW